LSDLIRRLSEDRSEIGILRGRLGSEDPAERTLAHEALGQVITSLSEALEFLLRYIIEQREGRHNFGT
jgi:hypothetical protein